MRWLAAIALVGVGCSRAAWVAPAPSAEGASEGAAMEMLRVQVRATEEREAEFVEALHPGTRRQVRAARLAHGGLEAFRDEGEGLFALDTPWDAALPATPVSPLHARGGATTADATRCWGCHHVGGVGGSGGFGDLAFYEARGDDVLSARRRLPPMLAGAALLERAADGHPDRIPFGWSKGQPRTLREMVRASIDLHLGAGSTRATDDEVDALAAFVALLSPPRVIPPPHDSLVLRAAHGAELFHRVGCDGCHADPLSVENPVLPLSHGRRIDLRFLLSRDGAPPFEVSALTDLHPHHMGAALADETDEKDAKDDLFVTAPLWGVASRGPWLHDGRAATMQEAVLDHGGEAQKARDAFAALGGDQADLMLYLATLTRAPVMTWMR